VASCTTVAFWGLEGPPLPPLVFGAEVSLRRFVSLLFFRRRAEEEELDDGLDGDDDDDDTAVSSSMVVMGVGLTLFLRCIIASFLFFFCN